MQKIFFEVLDIKNIKNFNHFISKFVNDSNFAIFPNQK